MAINFPDSPSDNDIYTVNGKRWIYSSGKWSIYGSTAPDATASDTEPSGVGDGHIWYRSDQSQTLIRYDNTWVEVGSAGGFDNASTNFPTSLDSATGFAAVEALQAKVGVDSSAVTSSLDYKVAQLEAGGSVTSYTPTWTNITIGNASTNIAWYSVTDGIVHLSGKMVFGSTTAFTAQVPGINLPSGVGTPVTRTKGLAVYYDVGTNQYTGNVQIDATLTELDFFSLTVTSNYPYWSYPNTTIPFTWTAGDEMFWNISYPVT